MLVPLVRIGIPNPCLTILPLSYPVSFLKTPFSNVSSASIIVVIIIIFSLFSAGDQTQGLMYARQMLFSIELHSLAPREVFIFICLVFLDSLAI